MKSSMRLCWPRLRVISDLGAKEVEVYLDSQLVVNQVQGRFEAKDP